MKSVIEVQGKRIGDGCPLFIASECGVTCNQSIELAKQLVDATADSGADAIKFIFSFPEEFMSDHDVEYEYDTVEGRKKENMLEMLTLGISLDEWKEVKRYTEEKGLIFFASVDAPKSLEYGEACNIPIYKMSSWDFNYHWLWREVAKFKKPMFIDTGPVDFLDVAKVMKIMEEEGNDEAVLVHCFHTRNPAEMNMKAIPYMRKAFGCPVGFSAEGREDEEDIMAVSLGACVLEKRLTIRRDLPGHHHILSKEPEEFKEYVELMRKCEKMVGQEALIPSKKDMEERKKWFRRIVANKNLKAGTVLKEGDLEGKRPEDGVSPEYQGFFVGRELKRDLKENEPVSWGDV